LKKIRVTFDDSYLFTAGEDGMLIIYEIKDRVYFILSYYRRVNLKEIKME